MRVKGFLCVSILWLFDFGTASRTPLIVFQHEIINYASEDIIHKLISQTATLPEYHYHHHHYGAKIGKHIRTLYQTGNSEKDLPECEPWAVCSKVDVYDTPWLERQCRCPNHQKCPGLVTPNDGHTITDKTRQFKLCEPVKNLPTCGYFRDVTWTLTSGPDNITSQVVHCHCPKGAIAYLIKRQPYQTRHGQIGYHYSFACSPQSNLRCQRKEPCRLFSVRKRSKLLDEVNTNTLCQCPHNHHCPKHHTHPGVLQGKSYVEESIRTYSAYCLN
ncbi:protein giant-lens [Cimex lectularius]|uniref:Protein giant-lens n=1 Tax=Cimex lectularius TaxID=79782 RepID=A0A8I6RW68_CIMLE|nr:protein giant-lens [Cimex lectularius]